MSALLLQKSCQSSLESRHKPSNNGKQKANYKLSVRKEDIVGMSTQTQSNNQIQRERRRNTFTQESLPSNSKATFKDKLLCSRKNIPRLRLSKTLDQESISKEEVSSPFWTRSLEETYHKLWLPTETDLLDLDSTLSNTSLIASRCPLKSCQMMTSKSLQQNWPRTSFQSLQFSQPDTMDLNPIKFCRKIRFYPNLEQVRLLNRCVGASRFFYNKAIATIKEKGAKGLLSRSKLRPVVMQSDEAIDENDPMSWQKEVPYDTRQEAIADAVQTYKNGFDGLKRGRISSFEPKFRSKKDTNQSFRVNKKALNVENMTIFTQRLKKNGRLRFRKRDLRKYHEDRTLDGNFMIVKTRPGYWYLCVPRTKEPPVFENPVYKSVFLDPGVRTFQTFYSPDGVCGKIGGDMINKKLRSLAERHDQLFSLSSVKGVVSKTKSHMRARCAMLRHKIKNVVEDLHWQTASFLCNTFQNIFLPKFEVSGMVEGSPLGSKITRSMLELSHYKFKERLLYYAKTKNRNVYLVGEEFTTKTCGRCGCLKEMEGSKTYSCPSCQTIIDRDYNGARNVCLKLVSKFL